MLPWLVKWPDAWAVPVTDWIGSGATWLLDLIKPVARFFALLLAYSMNGVNALFNGIPWPLMIGGITALGWFIGGLRMAALGLAGLGFIVASGYWSESMNTLALVTVSVPLALAAGGAAGILANEVPRVKSTIQTVMDVMQTVPTFA